MTLKHDSAEWIKTLKWTSKDALRNHWKSLKFINDKSFEGVWPVWKENLAEETGSRNADVAAEMSKNHLKHFKLEVWLISRLCLVNIVIIIIIFFFFGVPHLATFISVFFYNLIVCMLMLKCVSVWTHDLLVMSHPPKPLDHGFSPYTIINISITGSQNDFRI